MYVDHEYDITVLRGIASKKYPSSKKSLANYQTNNKLSLWSDDHLFIICENV